VTENNGCLAAAANKKANSHVCKWNHALKEIHKIDYTGSTSNKTLQSHHERRD